MQVFLPFFNYVAKLTSMITMGTLFFWPCGFFFDVVNVEIFHQKVLSKPLYVHIESPINEDLLIT